MRVTVLFFAAVKDLVGKDEITEILPPGVRDVRGFVSWLENVHPELTGRMVHVRIARNEQFAAPDEPLAEGDVLALVPPVAGG